MINFWDHADYKMLCQQYGGRLAGIILSNGCKNLTEFCERFDETTMERMPRMGPKTLRHIRAISKRENIPFRAKPLTERVTRVAPESCDNDLFLHSNHQFEGIMLGIGSRANKRTVTLSEDQTLKLAYRLMSLARGGETQGFEKLEREA